MKQTCLQIFQQMGKAINNPHVMSMAMTLGVTAISLYAPETFALNSEDQVAELKTLADEVGKLTKVACYVIGTVSAGIGALWAVGSQSLKVAAGAGAVTILAFKAPAFFAQTMII